MAESLRTSKDNDKHRKRQKSRDKNEASEGKYAEEGRAEAIPECAVCLQTCVHPAKLPCSHIFCFLCLKGLATQSRRCAMCRQDIPADYLDHPQLLDVPSQAEREAFEDGYQWFYEGRSGWWQYDERTSRELESAYKSGLRTCELLIVGQLYIADFDAMLQLRRNDLSRRRRIKRDLASIPKKGVAGLRLDGSPSTASDNGNGLAMPSTSQSTTSSTVETDLTRQRRFMNDSAISPDSWRSTRRENVGPSHEESRGVEHPDDSDDDELEIRNMRVLPCSDSETNDGEIENRINVGTAETDEAGLESQLSGLRLH